MNTPRIALCLEQTLGNTAYGRALESTVASAGLPHEVHRVEYPRDSRLPAPWALRGSMAAHRSMRARTLDYDAAFYHTQSIALMAPRSMGPAPYVVSVDATPAQMDDMGEWYEHRRWPFPLEAAKRRWHRRTFRKAAAVVAWSRWAADSVVRDYGVDADDVHVVHPGARGSFFDVVPERRLRRPAILFVGGAFERKGGFDLLRAFRRLEERAELLLVTEAVVPPMPGVRVLRGAQPGSPELLRAFAQADIFCLPTLADTLVLAIGEAMAAGLPVVSTSVGAIPEWVVDGETGLLHPPGDEDALLAALRTLIGDADLRTRMGDAGRARALEHMNAERNAGRVIDLLKEVAS